MKRDWTLHRQCSSPSYFHFNFDGTIRILNRSFMNPITIVSDPGIDDIVGLLLLSKLSPNAPHALIATFGNVPIDYTFQNAKEFIAAVSPTWSVTKGSSAPLQPLEHPWATYFHGPDGVAEAHPTISLSDVKILEQPPQHETMISVGPMTDVWHSLQEFRPSTLTIMGGAFTVKGNETAYAETNIAFDPDAAAQTFQSCQGIDVMVLGLDVTKTVYWTRAMTDAIPETNTINNWIKKMLTSWWENYGGKRETVFHLHDPLAVYSLFFPDEIEWLTSGVRVETVGERRGQTVLEPKNPPCKVAQRVPNAERVAQHIYEIIFSPSV